MTKWIISFTITAALALTFSGCGGSSGSSDKGSNTEEIGKSINDESSVDNRYTPNQFDSLPDVPFPEEMKL